MKVLKVLLLSSIVFAVIYAMEDCREDDDIMNVSDEQDVYVDAINHELERTKQEFEQVKQATEQKLGMLLQAKRQYCAGSPLQQQRIKWLYRLDGSGNSLISSLFHMPSFHTYNIRPMGTQFSTDTTAILEDEKRSIFDLPSSPQDLREWAVSMRAIPGTVEKNKKIFEEIAAQSPKEGERARAMLRMLDDAEVINSARSRVEARNNRLWGIPY